MNTLSEKQLAAQLGAWKRKLEPKEKPSFYGVRTHLAYSGPERIVVDREPFHVKTCRSDLEARELLAELEEPKAKAVLLFNFPHELLGADLISRFAARRLLSIDTTSALKELYAAETIDPRIGNKRELIEALVEKASAGQTVATPAGVLEVDFAWSILMDCPDFAVDRPDLTQVMRMSLAEEGWQPIASLEDPIKQAFFDWIAERTGRVAEVISAAVVEQKTAPELLMPIGLCLEAIFGDAGGEPEELKTQARTRLEVFLAGQVLDADAAKAWHEAARLVTEKLDAASLRSLSAKVDDMLKALKAEALAVQTPLSRRGLDDRFAGLADAILSFLRRKGDNGLPDMLHALALVERHHLVKLEDFQERVRQARMTVRLAQWIKLEQRDQPGRSVKRLSRIYLTDSSYADRALMEIAEISDSHVMGKACAKVRQLALERRLGEQRQFSAAFAAWNENPSQEANLGVEHVLDTFVAPLATHNPVLVLVMDGMSCAVFSELLEDLRERDWYTIISEHHPQTVLAALPSVTALSRKALFSGRIDHSDSRVETVAFRESTALAGVSTKNKPILFLKGDLSDPGSTGLSTRLGESIADNNCRVVGVLLNVIDDQLSGSDQLRVRWKVDSIRYLAEILEMAAESKRTLLLVSDHGNILEWNQSKKLGEGSTAGDRYRYGGELWDPDNEVLVSGKRIEHATGKKSVIAASTEGVRYGSKKTGYHGGCSDREMVVPVSVLQAITVEEQPEGWKYGEYPVPLWWKLSMDSASEISETGKPEKSPKPKTKPAKTDETDFTLELSLELESDGRASAKWISSLLESQVYHEQWDSLGRAKPKESDVRAFLEIMHEHDGATAKGIMAGGLGYSPMRLRGFLAQLRRLFNVDGYEIIAEELETGRIEFDLPLAKKQFDLEDNS